jgi:hypothetical protein
MRKILLVLLCVVINSSVLFSKPKTRSSGKLKVLTVHNKRRSPKGAGKRVQTAPAKTITRSVCAEMVRESERKKQLLIEQCNFLFSLCEGNSNLKDFSLLVSRLRDELKPLLSSGVTVELFAEITEKLKYDFRLNWVNLKKQLVSFKSNSRQKISLTLCERICAVWGFCIIFPLNNEYVWYRNYLKNSICDFLKFYKTKHKDAFDDCARVDNTQIIKSLLVLPQRERIFIYKKLSCDDEILIGQMFVNSDIEQLSCFDIGNRSLGSFETLFGKI